MKSSWVVESNVSPCWRDVASCMPFVNLMPCREDEHSDGDAIHLSESCQRTRMIARLARLSISPLSAGEIRLRPSSTHRQVLPSEHPCYFARQGLHPARRTTSVVAKYHGPSKITHALDLRAVLADDSSRPSCPMRCHLRTRVRVWPAAKSWPASHRPRSTTPSAASGARLCTLQLSAPRLRARLALRLLTGHPFPMRNALRGLFCFSFCSCRVSFALYL